MLMELYLEKNKAYEEYLAAKEAYENWRDGYMPYFEDKDYFASELERLMVIMDYAEDWYNLISMEYDDALNDEYHRTIYTEVNGRPYPNGLTLKEMHDKALELKNDYYNLAEGSIPFNGSNSALRSELERRREAWHLAFDDYSDALDHELLKRAKQGNQS